MFYQFEQNNVSSNYELSDTAGIGHIVIIEAADAEQANEKAQLMGLYFNGVKSNIDCKCCGNRWSEATEHDGFETPYIYGQDIEKVTINANKKAFVHYLNGNIKQYNFKSND